jgi:UDP:flavonoid glycosyltransferase YjiC (YdhE family)
VSRIVINSWGSYGDVYPYIGIGKALQARGHHVTLALPRYYVPMVEKEGLAARAVGPDIDPNDRERIAAVMDPAKGPERLIRGWVMPALRQSYEELREAAADADVLVTHPATFAAPVLAAQRKIPWVATVLAPMSFFSTTDLPALPPAPRLVHLRRLGPWFGRLIVRAARHATRDWSGPIYRFREELGLPRGGDPIFEGQFSPTLNLALFSRVMAAPQPDWPAHVNETGFVFYNGPDPLSAELETFLASGPPPVVFTLGTSAVGAAGTFYEESAAAVAKLGMRAVLLAGPFEENRPRRTISRDILIVDRAPHQLLFPRAAAIVHQGGIGTTAQALRSGRPAIVVPHSHDQPDNAFRVTSLGVARTIFPGAYRAARVARELSRLLGDSTSATSSAMNSATNAATGYVARAAKLAESVRAENGAEAAADAIAHVASTVT